MADELPCENTRRALDEFLNRLARIVAGDLVMESEAKKTSIGDSPSQTGNSTASRNKFRQSLHRTVHDSTPESEQQKT